MDRIFNVLAGVAMSLIVFYTGMFRLSDLLFPVVFVYHIATFRLAYLEAGVLRTILTTFCLSFVDIVVSVGLFQVRVPDSSWVWLLEFLVLVYMSSQISDQELKVYLSHDFLRLVLFVLAGLIKSVSLVSSLVMMAEIGTITEIKTFITLFILGMMKLGSSFGVYFLDVLYMKKKFGDNVIDEIWKRLKYLVIAVFVAIEACAYYNDEIKSNSYSLGRFLQAQDILFCKSFREVHLISGVYMGGLYAYYSYQYGVVLIEKLND